MDWLYPFYIAATVFGVGVTAIDMFGMLGGQSQEGGVEDNGAAAEAVADNGVADNAVEATGVEDNGAEESGDGRPSIVAHDRRQRGIWVLRFMSVARSVVYFCVGFGPVGWFALGRGESATASLIWSVPVGAAVMIGARLLRRVLRHELDSQLRSEDLLMEKGVVSVSIGAGRMGKVRILVGGTYAERFARTKDAELSIPKGASVRVVEVADDCVYVESEDMEEETWS